MAITDTPNQRTLVLHPVLKAEREAVRHAPYRLEEAIGLAHAIALEVVHSEIVPVSRIQPATYIGSGKIEELHPIIKNNDIPVVIVDEALSPVQQSNLEKAWGCKVIDRTALIIEIFGARARTNEGKLQVELASLEYQRTRLVRSWTHLERQRGGGGFMGGPGEKQLEMDKRTLSELILKIKRQLNGVKRTRELHRASRRTVPYPIVALVGYTNAGKSTLFNRLTGAGVLAEDKLFATLDPSMRLLELPSHKKIILSDTVGFISHLPTELVMAFRATLEEVIEADLLLHVRDCAHEQSEQQRRDVLDVLHSLGITEKASNAMIDVLNKIDLLPAHDARLEHVSTHSVGISALRGEGIERLLEVIDIALSAKERVVDITIPVADGKQLAWIYRNATVQQRQDRDEDIMLKISISEENYARLSSNR